MLNGRVRARIALPETSVIKSDNYPVYNREGVAILGIAVHVRAIPLVYYVIQPQHNCRV